MTEINLTVVDQRNTVELVDQRPNIEVTAPGPQGPGPDITVSPTPPDNPNINAIWVQV